MYSQEQLKEQLKLRKKCVEFFENNYLTYSFDRLVIESLSYLIPQSWGTKIQNYICNKLKFKNVCAGKNKGDLFDEENNIYYELKTSMLNDFKESLNFNVKNIRLWQDVDFYLCLFIDVRDIDNIKHNLFILSKEDMINEVELLKANPTNGTKEANINNSNIDLSFSIKVNSSNYKRWVEKYLYEIDFNS